MAHRAAPAERVPLFIRGPAKAGCRIDAAEPPPRIIALLYALVIMRDPVVQIQLAAMDNVLPQCLADRSRIRVMTIGRHALGYLPSDI